MPRSTDRLLVAVYVALAALPVVAMRMGWKDRELHGALPPAPLPAITFSDILSEKVQHGLLAWFESNLGFKGTSIGLDNALLYHAFSETKAGSGVRIGKNHVLFGNEDIDYYNKTGRWVTDPAYVNRLADQIADVQHRMAARHQAFVPVIVPAKTSIWRDNIPDGWTMDVPWPRASDESTRMIQQALVLRSVEFVDARELLAAVEDRTSVYSPDARHWSSYGACLTMMKVNEAYARLTGQPRLAYDCELAWERTSRGADDYDLWRLLNARWVYPVAKRLPIAKHRAPPQPPSDAPGVLFTGTSFCWQLLDDARASGVFRRQTLNYYNQVFADSQGSERITVDPDSPVWRDLTMNNELVVLDLFEGYFGSPDAYPQVFLDHLAKELHAHP